MGRHGQESAGDVLHRPGVSEAETTISDTEGTSLRQRSQAAIRPLTVSLDTVAARTLIGGSPASSLSERTL